MRLFNPLAVAQLFDLRNNLLRHIGVVVIERQRVLNRKPTPNIQRIERRANPLQVAIHIHTLQQLAPVVSRVVNPRIDKEVEHLEFELLACLDLLLIERHNILIANAQARCVEFELRLLLRSNPNAHLHLVQPLGQELVISMQLAHIVEHGDGVFITHLKQTHDVFDILGLLKAIADHITLLAQLALADQRFDNIDVKSRRSLNVHIVFEHLLEHKAEVRALGAIAVLILPLVVGLGHRHIEQHLGLLDLLADLGQIRNLERSAVLLDDVHQVDPVPQQIVSIEFELVLGPFKGLLDQVGVFVAHGG